MRATTRRNMLQRSLPRLYTARLLRSPSWTNISPTTALAQTGSRCEQGVLRSGRLLAMTETLAATRGQSDAEGDEGNRLWSEALFRCAGQPQGLQDNGQAIQPGRHEAPQGRSYGCDGHVRGLQGVADRVGQEYP